MDVWAEAPPSSDVSGDGDVAGWLWLRPPSGNLIVDLPLLVSVGDSVLGLGVEVVGDIVAPPSPAPSIVGWRSQEFTGYCWPARLKYTRV